MIELFLDRYVYLLVLVLLAIGLYGMLAKGDLAKKVIGMTIYTTAIYLFFIEGSLQVDATTPVIDPELGSDPGQYVDPLPHLLILTAIVVGVGIVGVALSLLVRIHRAHGTLDEAVVADRLSGRLDPIGVPGGDGADDARGAGDAGAGDAGAGDAGADDDGAGPDADDDGAGPDVDDDGAGR